MKNTTHYLAAISAFTIWGFFSLVLRPLAIYSSLDILFFRVFVSATLMSWRPSSSGERYEGEPAVLRFFIRHAEKGLLFQLFGGGFSSYGQLVLFYLCYQPGEHQGLRFAYLVCPVLTTVLAFFILREKLTRGNGWRCC